MIIKNALINDELKSVVIKDGKIAQITNEPLDADIDAKGQYLIPGLIDIHSHGLCGMDTMDADFEGMCKIYAKKGTTSLLPTTMTMDTNSLLRVCNANMNFKGANILGIHLEGPYISKKYKGAQNEKYIKNPDINEFIKFPNVKMITVAPELEGALDFIKLASKKCVVSIGHTDCDYQTALAAIENGACCLTHTYNAMAPFNHRNSGPIGAGFEKQIYAQLICDGFHISKPVVLATYKMFGAEKLILISDSIRPAFLVDGEYDSGGLSVNLENNIARLKNGTIAGSTSCLWDCVKKAVEFGIPFEDAVYMATTAPARLLKLNKGEIKVGFDADLLLVSRELEIQNVIINGEIFD